MSKTICIYHSRDLDGWMSAAIVKKWFIENNKSYRIREFNTEVEEINHPPILDMLAWDYGDEIPDTSVYDKVIMCDVSFPKEEMNAIYMSVEYGNFIWCDHHISAINSSLMSDYEDTSGERDTKYAACELTWDYFFPKEEMPEIVRLLGRYDCFGHKGTDEEQRVLEFQYGARVHLTAYETCYDALISSISETRSDGTIPVNGTTHEIQMRGTSIYQYLCAEAKQIYTRAFPISLGENDPSTEKTNEDGITTIDGTMRKFLAVNQERFNPINFGINYHEDGYDGFACFWYKNGNWHWSLYNDNGEVDCSTIAKEFGGGGHKGAAGFVCKPHVNNNLVGSKKSRTVITTNYIEKNLGDINL